MIGISAYREAKAVIEYDPESGLFQRLDRKTGWFAGSSQRGYLNVMVKGTTFKSHRLAWFLMYGWLPVEIDHINRDKSDNRIANLRPSNRSSNSVNWVRKGANPHRCVYTRGSKFTVVVVKDQKRYYFGTFTTLQEAIEEADRRHEQLHGIL